MKKTVCVDLDATLLEYHGWKGDDHFGEPRPGAKEFLFKLKDIATVVIFTTRTKMDVGERPEGSTPESLARAIGAWLDKHGMVYDTVYTGQGKPFAAAFVDDRNVGIRANPVEENFILAYEEVVALINS